MSPKINHKTWKIVVQSGLAFGAMLSFQANASSTRLKAVNQATLFDETEVLEYPSLKNRGEFFLGELGDAGLQDAYIAGYLKQSPQASMGFTLSRDTFYEELNFLSRTWTNGLFDTTRNDSENSDGIYSRPENSFEFIYSRNLDRNKRFGLRVGNAEKVSEVSSENATKTTRESVVTQLTLGFGMDNWDASYQTFLRQNYLNQNEAGTSKTEETFEGGNKTQKLSLRYMYSPKTKLELLYNKSTPKVTFTSAAVKRGVSFQQQAIALSAKHAIVQNKRGEIVLSSTLAQLSEAGPLFKAATNSRSITSSDRKSEFSSTALAAAVGFDFDLDVWGLRALGGLTHNLYGRSTLKDKTTDQTVTTKTSIAKVSDPSLYSLGLSYLSGKVRVDATYERSFLYSGPFFISGNSRGGNTPLLSKLAVKYEI